jgi:hypothetical protein
MSRPLDVGTSAPLQSASHGGTPAAAAGSARPPFRDVTLRQLPSYLRLHVLGMQNMRNLYRSFTNWYITHYFKGNRIGPLVHCVLIGTAVGWWAHTTAHGWPN